MLLRSRKEGCGSEMLFFPWIFYESSFYIWYDFCESFNSLSFLFLLVFGLTGPDVAFSVFSFSKARSFQPQPTRYCWESDLIGLVCAQCPRAFGREVQFIHTSHPASLDEHWTESYMAQVATLL